MKVKCYKSVYGSLTKGKIYEVKIGNRGFVAYLTNDKGKIEPFNNPYQTHSRYLEVYEERNA